MVVSQTLLLSPLLFTCPCQVETYRPLERLFAYPSGHEVCRPMLSSRGSQKYHLGRLDFAPVEDVPAKPNDPENRYSTMFPEATEAHC